MSIFGAIVFASFIMTSCGGAATDEAASKEAGAPTTEVKAEVTATQESTTSSTPMATAEAGAPVSANANSTSEAN